MSFGGLSNYALAPDYMAGVALGLHRGQRFHQMVGYSADIDVVHLPTTLRPTPGMYVWPTAAVAVQVLSTSALDAAAGTGARTVRISGLDVAGVEIQEIVTLNGITPVNATLPFWRINQLLCLTAGSTGFNQGTITVRTVVGATSLFAIPPLMGRGQTCIYTVPAGHSAAIVDIALVSQEFSNATSFVAMHLYTRLASDPSPVWLSRLYVVTAVGNPNWIGQPRQLGVLPPLTDINFVVTGVGNNNNSASAFVSFLISEV